MSNGDSGYRRDRTYLSRDEFEVFEKNVERSFSDVSRSLTVLSDKIDQIATRGTDWKAITGGLSVFATFIFGIGGVISWGINQKIDSISMDSIERHEVQEKLINTLNNTAIKNLEGFSAHDAAVSKLNQEQSSGIISLEKEINRLAADSYSHFKEEGHPEMIAGIETNAKAVLQLDETLQREMRILDDRIQAEMRLLDEHQNDISQERNKRLSDEIHQLFLDIAEIKKDLNSREGQRWTREHYDKYVKPKLEEYEHRIDVIESNRFGTEEGIEHTKRISYLEGELKLLSSIVGEIREEQKKRTEKVYEDKNNE